MEFVRTSALIAFACTLLVPAASPAATDPLYAQLRAARPDGRRIDVAGVEFAKESFRFRFEGGEFHLLAPVAGRTIGAVFVGRGSYELTPATETERRHLARLAGEKALERWSDSFERMLVLAADDTLDALAVERPVTVGAAAPSAVAAFDALFGAARDVDHFGVNLHLRVAQDLINSPNSRHAVFLALVNGARLSPALLAVDPLGADAIGLVDGLGGEDVALVSGETARRGFWYLSHRQWEIDKKRPVPYLPPADALHYRVETRVVRNTEIEGETTITFAASRPGVRLIPLHLFRKLRLSSAMWSRGDGVVGAIWEPATWVQEAETQDADAAVVLSAPLAQGEVASVRLRYSGKEVLYDIGDKNFVVAARTTWYPNLGTFVDAATYELTFHLPQRSDVVATGKLVSQRDESGGIVSVWRSDVPLRVAGFNYGRFKRKEVEDAESGMRIEVFTSGGTPGYLRELQAHLDHSGLGGEAGALPQNLDDPSGLSTTVTVAPNVSNFNTSKLAEVALADATNAGRTFGVYFGRTAFDRLAITQQAEWTYGQSWPTLVFLPYWSFINPGLRQQLGLQAIRTADAEALAFHEIAHQWWGHQVGWASYRDQWLSEGFAQFSALLAVQLTRGWMAAERMLRLEREDLFENAAGVGTANDAGPISLGFRLDTFRNPGTYQRVVYGKGMFVLHMLRMMMQAPGSDPDAAFRTMMRDYVVTWSGKRPSTADFQKITEKHMVPAMNATGDGKMDWFFRQWVAGTEVPTLRHDLEARPEGTSWRVTGTIRQSGVGSDFRSLVPVYIELEARPGAMARVASVPLIGESSRAVDFQVDLPSPPKRVVINAHYDVLARD